MTDSDWGASYAKSLAVFLNGDAISEPDPRGGKITDAKFLLLFNAHSNPLTFTLPEAGYAAGWEVVIDTASGVPGRDPPAEEGDRGPRPRRGRATVHPVTLRQLFPVAADQPDLPALYAYPDGRWLRANMVSSADGAATLGGLTQGLSSDADRRVFALLRTLSDVILVGAATARDERYKPARPRELWRDLRDGRPLTPPIAVVTRRLDLDPDSPLITAAPPDARTIVITVGQAPADLRAELARHADVIMAGEETVDLEAAVVRWPSAATGGCSPRAARTCSPSCSRPACWTSCA